MRLIKPDNNEYDDIFEGMDAVQTEWVKVHRDDMGESWMLVHTVSGHERLYHLNDLDEGTLDERLSAVIDEVFEAQP